MTAFVGVLHAPYPIHYVHSTRYSLHTVLPVLTSLEVDSALKDKERVGAMAKLSKSMEHEHQLALEAALKAKEAEGHAERVDQEKMLAMTNERLMDAVNQLCELGMEPSRWEKLLVPCVCTPVYHIRSLRLPRALFTTSTIHHVHYSPHALFATHDLTCIVRHT